MSDLKQNKTHSSDSALIKIVDVVLPGYFKQIKIPHNVLKKRISTIFFLFLMINFTPSCLKAFSISDAS